MRPLFLFFLCLIGVSSFIVYEQYSEMRGFASKISVPCYEKRPLMDDSLVETLAFDSVQGDFFAQEKEKSSFSSFVKHSRYATITKDFFRCRGSSLHTPLPVLSDGKVVENIFDCGGSTTHSLPIHEGKEFIYPVLIDVLNWIQRSTKKQVVITSGHRCPQHHRYVTAKGGFKTGKHMIGAAVTFYVAGLEGSPKEVLKAIFSYYNKYPAPEKERKKYTDFQRSEQSAVSTPPWYNKEIMVTLFKQNEGRDGDNSHPFPFFLLQVLFDRDKNSTVLFKQPDAENIYRF